MKNIIQKYLNSESGAVTVDWVVLTAAVVGLAVAAYTSIESGGVGLADNTTSFLDARDPN